MNRTNPLWLGIAVVAFCLGIGIGRFTSPSKSQTGIARAPISSANQTATQQASEPNIQSSLSVTKNAAGESANSAAGDVYTRIRDALAAPGTGQIYESFGKFSNLIDEKNVRDVLTFAERISKKEQKDALTSLILARWAEFDPKRALEFTQNISDSRSRASALANALSSWAQRDSASAIAWAQQMPGGSMRDQTIHAVLAT